jgi:hypothetical protein
VPPPIAKARKKYGKTDRNSRECLAEPDGKARNSQLAVLHNSIFGAGQQAPTNPPEGVNAMKNGRRYLNSDLHD